MGAPDLNQVTRRILVILSDGDDNSSYVNMKQTTSDVVASGVVMFTLATQTGDPADRGQRILQSFAAATGGEFFKLKRNETPKIFEDLREAIQGMYYVRYEAPPSSGNNVHEVEIKPAPKQKLALSYPRTYLATP
jgi:hypothetical protein